MNKSIRFSSAVLPAAAFAVFLALLPSLSPAEQVFETFLAPKRVVDVTPSQHERLAEVLVTEGEAVTQGQLLAAFDSRVLKARLALLEKASSFHGAVDSARALVTLRKSKLATLEELAQSGNARPQEIETARTNLAIAEAQLLEAREIREFKESEQAVVLAQIDETKLFSPIDGTVAKINKFAGDLVGGPGAEPIMTLVQLNPLAASFHLPPEQAAALSRDRAVALELNGEPVDGSVIFIAPLIEAQSGTVLVRVEIPNPDGSYLSGRRINLSLNPIMETN